MNGRSLIEEYPVPVIAGISLLILLIIFILPKPTFISTCCTSTPPSAIPSTQTLPSNDTGSESLIFANLTPNGKFDTLIERGLYTDEHAGIAAEMQQAFDYVSPQFRVTSALRFKAIFAIDEQCNLHGIMRADERTAQVYTCNDISRTRAIAIMAHELAHQLEFDQYGPPHLNGDQILVEGMATWAAGKYWLGEHPDFRSYVREQRNAGALSPLATTVGREDFTNMNKLYYQWASFVDFLIDRYTRERFDQLYVTGHLSAGSADYSGVYGKDLNLLEQEWQSWLDS